MCAIRYDSAKCKRNDFSLCNFSLNFIFTPSLPNITVYKTQDMAGNNMFPEIHNIAKYSEKTTTNA